MMMTCSEYVVPCVSPQDIFANWAREVLLLSASRDAYIFRIVHVIQAHPGIDKEKIKITSMTKN